MQSYWQLFLILCAALAGAYVIYNRVIKKKHKVTQELPQSDSEPLPSVLPPDILTASQQRLAQRRKADDAIRSAIQRITWVEERLDSESIELLSEAKSELTQAQEAFGQNQYEQAITQSDGAYNYACQIESKNAWLGACESLLTTLNEAGPTYADQIKLIPEHFPNPCGFDKFPTRNEFPNPKEVRLAAQVYYWKDVECLTVLQWLLLLVGLQNKPQINTYGGFNTTCDGKTSLEDLYFMEEVSTSLMTFCQTHYSGHPFLLMALEYHSSILAHNHEMQMRCHLTFAPHRVKYCVESLTQAVELSQKIFGSNHAKTLELTQNLESMQKLQKRLAEGDSKLPLECKTNN